MLNISNQIKSYIVRMLWKILIFNAIFLICNDVQCDYDVDYQASVYSLKSQLDSFTMIYLEIY